MHAKDSEQRQEINRAQLTETALAAEKNKNNNCNHMTPQRSIRGVLTVSLVSSKPYTYTVSLQKFINPHDAQFS